MSFKLILITPEKKLFEEKIDSLRVPGVDGSFSILKNHASMIAGMKKGKLTIKQNDKLIYYYVDSGFVEVNNNTVSVLADKAEIA